MNERLRKSILKILKEHENDNLASEAARDMITDEIVQLSPKVHNIDISNMTYDELSECAKKIREGHMNEK